MPNVQFRPTKIEATYKASADRSLQPERHTTNPFTLILFVYKRFQLESKPAYTNENATRIEQHSSCTHSHCSTRTELDQVHPFRCQHTLETLSRKQATPLHCERARAHFQRRNAHPEKCAEQGAPDDDKKPEKKILAFRPSHMLQSFASLTLKTHDKPFELRQGYAFDTESMALWWQVSNDKASASPLAMQLSTYDI